MVAMKYLSPTVTVYMNQIYCLDLCSLSGFRIVRQHNSAAVQHLPALPQVARGISEDSFS